MTLKREQREDEENKRMSAIKLFVLKTETITRMVSWTYLLFSRANKTTILGIALSGQELHHLLTGLMFTAEIDLVSQCYCTRRNHVNSRKPSGSLWGHFLLKLFMYLGPRRCV